MRVAGVIVNFRTPELTARAASALLAELEAVGDSHVYVVDNDSGDGSYERLLREAAQLGWGERASVLASPRNGGYGYGINLAIERAFARQDPPDYVYVINSDAFADRGSVGKLLAFMESHPDVGIVGSHVHGPDGESQGAAFRFPTLWSELENAAGFGVLSSVLREHIVALPKPEADQPSDWVPGTSMMIRRQALEQAGLFDEGFFLYFEEIDLCRRMQLAGWKCFYVEDAPITHIGCVSTGMLETDRPMPRYWQQARHRYFLKHHGRAYAAACDAAWVAGYAVSRAKCALQKRKPHHRPHMLRDLLLSSVRDLTTLRPPRPESAKVEPKSDVALQVKAQRPLLDTRPVEELRLVDLLLEDFATHDRDPLQPGFWALTAHRVGRRADALAREQPRKGAALDAAYHVLSTATDWIWGIHLPRSVQVGRRVRLWHNGCMVLTARTIGNDVHIRHDTTFGPAFGDGDEVDVSSLPTIEDRADIGSGACVLGAVTVGHDVMVGANSVVMKSVPPHATVLGVPARIIPA